MDATCLKVTKVTKKYLLPKFDFYEGLQDINFVRRTKIFCRRGQNENLPVLSDSLAVFM